jgi:hypothetical protein
VVLELTNEAVGDIKSPIFSRILYRRAEFSIGFTDKWIIPPGIFAETE